METPQTTTMTNPPERTRMVQGKRAYIRAIRPIRLSNGSNLRENQVAEVSEKDAKEFADKKFDNAYPYSGERQSQAHDAQKGVIVRAVRITEAEYKQGLKATDAEDEEEAS